MISFRKAATASSTPSPHAAGAAAPPGEGADEAHLLVVDDVPANRALLTRRFTRHGYRVTEAEDGERALALVASQSFDAVLLDVMMPGIDGIEVLRRIRASHTPSELPVIMVTAKTQSQDLVAAFENMANDYITKPVDFAVALARVKGQVSRKKAEDEIKRIGEALRRSNETLENRVAERTAQLSDINDQLKSEIQQRAVSEAQSLFLARHDTLTGLPNRLQFRHDLEAALASLQAHRRPLAVLFIDLDGFKSVNDTLGHSIGDLLLKAVAGDIQHLIGDGDCIARLGGDEFAVLTGAGHEVDGAEDLARRIVATARQVREIEGHQILVGASVGIVPIDDPRADPELLLKHADLAMYRAKEDGRGTYRFFNVEMDLKAQARRSLELDLRSAFTSGQLKLYYQPLIALKGQQVTGFEALLRWQHPVRGLVSPADFIPVAEEMGLIVQIGDWVLRQACARAALWPEGIRIAVNVSPVQFARGNIVATVVSALAAASLAPSRLEIEVTESVLLEHTEHNIAVLQRLRDLGVRISMDDFGTGYSSLGYLRRFQFDKIKIDRSFVQDLTHNLESDAIVHAIAGLGSKFGIHTTAEGVETREQRDRLDSEGCTEAQGRFYSMPVPEDEVDGLLAAYGLT